MTGAPSILAGLSADVSRIAAQAAGATVRIAVDRHSVSGFLIKPDIAVTASEALEGHSEDTIEIETAQGRRDATLVGHDPATDVAVLRLAQEVTGPALGDAAGELLLGQAVVCSGRLTHGAACALGIVSVAGPAWESMRGGRIDQRLELDARLPRGLEGSAVLDQTGALVGMAVFGRRRRVLVIPAATVRRAADELLQHGRIRRGYLGLGVHPVAIGEGASRRPGLIVLGLDAQGPARQAGLMQGDVIVSVAGQVVRSPRQLQRVLNKDMIGQRVGLDLIRAGEAQHIEVDVAAAPARR